MDAPDTLAVKISGVTKTFVTGTTRVAALRGIDLEVRAGELLMLVGPSGCGKTTLISVIAGILDQDEGQCLVYGQDLKAMGQQAKTHYRGGNIGFVFQAFNLMPPLNAIENVAVPLLINGHRRGEALDKASAMLDRVGLAERKRALPSQLSGGQQQRVAIARALIHGPKLIVCDEPTSALDHETGGKVMDVLRTVALGAGRALVIVTHDARIFSYADRIAKMDDGLIRSVETGATAAAAAASH